MNTKSDFSIAIALQAIAAINVGNFVEVEIDGKTQTLEVLKKGSYTITVKGVTNLVLCPVSWTQIYKNLVSEKEDNDMTRMPSETVPSARGRGRPPKNANSVNAPVEHPASTAARISSPAPQSEVSAVSAAPNHFLPPGSNAKPTHPAPNNPPQGDDAAALEWLENRIADVVDSLRSELSTVIGTLLDREPPQIATETHPVRLTCADCTHAILATGLCSYYNMVPPMTVICNASKMCDDFEISALD